MDNTPIHARNSSPEGTQPQAIEKLQHWYRQLPDKKRYIEFVTAILTVPVMLTAIIMNVQSLARQNAKSITVSPTQSPIPTQAPKAILKETEKDSTKPFSTLTPSPLATITPNEQCKKEIGPVTITYPEEGTTLTKNPICIEINRTGSNYCSIVWAYRLTDESWSDFTDKSMCLYGLTAGQKNLQVKVKSIVTGEELILKRTFIVQSLLTPMPTSSSSPSASLSN